MGLLNYLFEALFPRKQYGKLCTTRHGIQVRSSAELRIADYFDSIGLRWEYEREIRTGWIFTRRLSCPDFYLPDYDVYVEYWGMVDVDSGRDRSRYERAMRYKMARYHQLGIKFISIYPDNLANFEWVFRKKFETVVGFKLPKNGFDLDRQLYEDDRDRTFHSR